MNTRRTTFNSTFCKLPKHVIPLGNVGGASTNCRQFLIHNGIIGSNLQYLLFKKETSLSFYREKCSSKSYKVNYFAKVQFVTKCLRENIKYHLHHNWRAPLRAQLICKCEIIWNIPRIVIFAVF